MSSIGQFLSEDHRRCDGYLLAAERAVIAQDWDAGQQSCRDFHQATEHHLAMEEQVLFAAYEALAGASGPSQVVFMQQHNMQEEQMLYPICDRLPALGREDLIARLRQVQAESTTESA